MNKINTIKEEVKKIIVGQEELVDSLLVGLIANGHILVEGVPGLAKTTAINAISKALGIDFKRIQFTPDLLPSDVTGTEIYNPKSGEFSVKQGPVFTNLLLADEINRAPAKVQSALLEVMQERQVTIGDESFKIEPPFLVMATQNPIEQEGIYALPEAQLDRFMMKIIVHHNNEEDELTIMRKGALKQFETVNSVLDQEDIKALQSELNKIHIDDAIERYMIRLITATREPEKFGLDIQNSIMYGASPRASIDLHKASRAKALLRGNSFVTPADIGYVVHNVLRHRIVLSYEARAKGVTTDSIISKIVETLPIP